MSRKVVVTGIGCITPVGNDADTTFTSLVAGQSGISPITLFDTSDINVKVAGEVKDFSPEDILDSKTALHTDRFAAFAIKASDEAINDSELTADDLENAGVIFGCGMGGIDTAFNETMNLLDNNVMSAFSVPMMISDAASSAISIRNGIKGTNINVSSACSSSADAIGLAATVIKSGDRDIMIAGGAEAIINPLGIVAFDSCKALSRKKDQTASSPFSLNRDGFVVGEGAACLILEEEQHAVNRGAKIYGRILSYASTSDAYHVTKPLRDSEGLQRALKAALEKAGIDTVDYINAHGTSTKLNDVNETNCYKNVFGNKAYDIPVSSTKSMTGHLIGAAGALEIMICLCVINSGIIPPTINLNDPDPECDLDYVPNVAVKKNVRTALSSSMGFGGHNSVIIVGGYDGE